MEEVKPKSKIRKGASRSQNESKPLPWWVEILFVQIGLPDNWLRNFLKTKKNISQYTRKYNNIIIIIALLTLAVSYIEPIMKRARDTNRCNKIAFSSFLEEFDNVSDVSINQSIIKAHNYCNGGKP